jgi:putative protease
MELVTYVGSAAALRAAVKNGADMVRAGLRGYCRSGSRSLTQEEFLQAATECLPRGVRLCAVLDLFIPSSRFPAAVNAAMQLAAAGVSAFCVGDLGLLRALHVCMPDIPLHVSDALGIHDSTGAALAGKLGASRILLPPQLSKEALERVLQRSQTEGEVQVCGFACVNCGSSCRLGKFSGKGSDSASACTRPCLESYGYASRPDGFRPAMKPVYLGDHLSALEKLGIHAVCIQAEDKSASFAGEATSLFYHLLHDRRPPSQEDVYQLLSRYFPEGTSDACYLGTPDEAILARDLPVRRRRFAAPAAKDTPEEPQRVPVTMSAVLRRGMPMQLRAEDREGHSASFSGAVPDAARSDKRELTEALLRTQLYNTLGTPFYCTEAQVYAEPGLSLSSLDVSRLRKAVLDRLLALRAAPPSLRTAPLPPLLRCESPYSTPELAISVRKAVQLSPELAALKPLYLYVPMEVLRETPSLITPFWENGHTRICAVLPPLVPDTDALETYRGLSALRDLHIEDVQIHSLSQLGPAKLLGFNVRCGIGMSVSNDWSLRVLQDSGASAATLAPELSFRQLRQLSKCIDTELYAYGRVPLLSTETCLIKTAGGSCDCHKACSLQDRDGRQYPLQRAGGCRNILYSADKLFLGDRLKELKTLGVRCLHLAFTTENAKECFAVAERYLGLNTYVPNARTRGFYEENKAGSGFRFSKKAGPSGDAGAV